MTTAVMGHDSEGRNVPFKVVLTLNCKETQGYLQPDNKVVEAFAESLIRRVAVRIQPPLLYPGLIENDEMVMMLMKREPTLSLREVGTRIKSGWHLEVAREIILQQVRRGLRGIPAEQMPAIVAEKVRVVLIDNELLEPESHLREVVSIFKNATFFRAGNQPGGIPRVIWRDTPMCDTCNIRMEELNQFSFGCKGCGSIKMKSL